MVWSVALSEQAERDLEAAVSFLVSKSPAAAERLGLGLVEFKKTQFVTESTEANRSCTETYAVFRGGWTLTRWMNCHLMIGFVYRAL